MSSESVTVARLGDIQLFRLAGEIDLANAGEIAAELERHRAAGVAVVIDLSAVSFIDSAGVRMLDAVVGDHEDRNVPLRLVVPDRGPVRTLLQLCDFREDLLTADVAGAARLLEA